MKCDKNRLNKLIRQIKKIKQKTNHYQNMFEVWLCRMCEVAALDSVAEVTNDWRFPERQAERGKAFLSGGKKGRFASVNYSKESDHWLGPRPTAFDDSSKTPTSYCGISRTSAIVSALQDLSRHRRAARSCTEVRNQRRTQ